ncbi:MAG: HAD family hydrolase [bacterium]|nr:HAD family hydrolase [Gammaproteobacteria bacterium]HIL95889.1 HAD family hydrolase [Pseudomonadales bacterium]
MTFNALAIDLDGTLLIGEELSVENRDAVRRANDAGFEIIIATARWRQMAEGVARQIGISNPIIACSGAQVFVPTENRDIFDHRLPPDFVSELYALCNDRRCVATITTENDVLIKLDGKPDPALLPNEITWVPELSVTDHKQPRIAAIQGSAIVKEIKNELFPQYASRVNIYDSIGPNGKIIITITANEANKGKALLASCEFLGIDPMDVVTFGDAENDIEMFKVSGASVAMAQASDLVKSAATTVTASNMDHGVALAIDRLLETGQP